MAEESEVWEEIRVTLGQLAEQGKRQTALLEQMAERGRRMERIARRGFIVGITAVGWAGAAMILTLMIGHEQLVEIPRSSWQIGWLMIGFAIASCMLQGFLLMRESSL